MALEIGKCDVCGKWSNRDVIHCHLCHNLFYNKASESAHSGGTWSLRVRLGRGKQAFKQTSIHFCCLDPATLGMEQVAGRFWVIVNTED